MHQTIATVKLQRHSAGIVSCLLVLFVWSVCAVGIVLCSPELAHAQTEVGTEYEPGIGVRIGTGLTVPFGVERRFETDIDDGGEVDEWRLHVGTGTRIMLSRQWQGALNVNYMYNRYDFSGSTGFGGLDPWEDLNFTTVTAPLTYILSKRWRFRVSPIFRISAESGADLSESISAGGFVAAIYSFSKTLSLGLGVGARTQIEDDPKLLLFPIIKLKFRLFRGSGSGNGSSSEGLTLASHNSPARGSGGVVTYDGGSNWKVGIGVTSQSRRFRLDDDGVAPDGVGEASSLPVWASITYKLHDLLTVEVYGGAALAGELKLEDRNGNEILDKDVDPVPTLGVTVTGSF